MTKEINHLCGYAGERMQKAVGIEVDFLRTRRTGIGNYTFHLLKHLMSENSCFEYFNFSGSSWRRFRLNDFENLAGAFTAKPAPKDPQVDGVMRRIKSLRTILRRTKGIRYRASSKHLSLYHAFEFVPSQPLQVPILPVVYDLSFERFPKFHKKSTLERLTRLPDIIRAAPAVQTISEFSKREIALVYGYPTAQIIVAPPAAPYVFRPASVADTDMAVRRFDLSTNSYFMMVGTLQPRKNLTTAIKAFASLPKKHRIVNPLVVVGPDGWGDLKLPPDTDALTLEGSLRFVGRIDEPELRYLYAGAIALLYPSIYEGFGMPVIEAMSCGTAVVHSRATAMDEVSGGLAHRVTALDVDIWHQTMAQLIETREDNHENARRNRILQARKFSWTESARTVLNAYRKFEE